jgi:hypothetical protein
MTLLANSPVCCSYFSDHVLLICHVFAVISIQERWLQEWDDELQQARTGMKSKFQGNL